MTFLWTECCIPNPDSTPFHHDQRFCHQEVGSTSPDALTLFPVLLLGLLLVPATLPGQVLVGPADLLDKQYI